MPPIPRIHHPTLSALHASLRLLTSDDILGCIERIEDLASELEPGRAYPSDYIVFRIGGSRTSASNAGADGTIADGAAWLRDLSALAERLSLAAGRTQAVQGASPATGTRSQPAGGEPPPPPRASRAGRHPPANVATATAAIPPGSNRDMLTLRELRELWGVSAKTIERLRREGLIARRTTGEGMRSTLLFRRAVVERFESAHGPRLARARAYARMTPEMERDLLRRASRYRQCLGWSRHAIARRLAERSGWSVEAVRQFLARHATSIGLGDEAGPIDARRRQVLWRAWRRGAEPAALGKRYDRGAGTVRRAIHLRRAELLRELAEQGHLATHATAAFERADAERLLLGPAPVRTGLGEPGAMDLASLVTTMRNRRPPVGVEERARGAAAAYLRWWAARRTAALSASHPAGPEIDEIETRLLWSARLMAEVLRPHLRLVLETLEHRLGVPIEETPIRRIPGLLLGGIAAAAEGLERFDPFAGGRAAAAVGLAVDRYAARVVPEIRHAMGAGTGRRAALVIGAGVEVADWTRSICAWQHVLEPDPRVRRLLAGLGGGSPMLGEVAAFLSLRYGWRDEPPRTLAELAPRFSLTLIRAPLFEQRCRREALAAARGLGGPGVASEPGRRGRAEAGGLG